MLDFEDSSQTKYKAWDGHTHRSKFHMLLGKHRSSIKVMVRKNRMKSVSQVCPVLYKLKSKGYAQTRYTRTGVSSLIPWSEPTGGTQRHCRHWVNSGWFLRNARFSMVQSEAKAALWNRDISMATLCCKHVWYLLPREFLLTRWDKCMFLFTSPRKPQWMTAVKMTAAIREND